MRTSTGLLALVLTAGKVSGRLLTADGRPAAGCPCGGCQMGRHIRSTAPFTNCGYTTR